MAKIACLLSLVLTLFACAWKSSDSGGGGGSSEYQFLYDHNAKELDGYTVRWASNTIKVYTGGISGAAAAINRWAGPVNFQFVDNPPSDGVSFSTTSATSYCGVTNTYYYNSGRIYQAQVRISSIQIFCRGGLENTVTHEMGHALGFFGHTSDGGLMDPDGGNGDITSPVRKFMNLLYSYNYGTDINPYLSLKPKVLARRYQPNGTQLIERVDY